MNYSELLKILRFIKDISQTELAQSLDVSKQYVNQIEKGKVPLSDKYLKKIEELYGVNFDELQRKVDLLTDQNTEVADNVKIVKLKPGQLLKIEYEN